MLTIFLFAGAILERAGLAAGFLAALIAIGAFVGRAQAVLVNAKERDIQRQTAIGGLSGLSFGLLAVLADAILASMPAVYKTLLLGVLATAVLAVVVVLASKLLNASNAITGVMVVLGACCAGLLAGPLSKRMPPPKRRH